MEVSGAVRSIYGSLGVKGLIRNKKEIYIQSSIKRQLYILEKVWFRVKFWLIPTKNTLFFLCCGRSKFLQNCGMELPEQPALQVMKWRPSRGLNSNESRLLVFFSPPRKYLRRSGFFFSPSWQFIILVPGTSLSSSKWSKIFWL